MAFYDVAGGMRFADIPAARRQGMLDGQEYRKMKMLQEHGPGIMNGDAASLAELSRFDPGAASTIQSRIASNARAAKNQAAADFEKNLERDMKVAEIMTRMKTPDEWNRMGAYLRDRGLTEAGQLIGKFDEMSPVFAGLSKNGTPEKIKELQNYVSMLPPEQQAEAMQAGLRRLITGSTQASWRPATQEEALAYGAAGGQINEQTGEFKPSPANKSMKIVSDGKGGFAFTDGVEQSNATIGQAYNPSEVQGTLDLLREIKTDPALSRATGPILGSNGNDVDALPLWQRLAMGGGAVSVTSKINMLQSRAWLAARDMLKGGGAITDYESRKASQAVERLTRAQTREDFVGALQDLEDAIISGMNKLEGANKLSPDDIKWLDQYPSGDDE